MLFKRLFQFLENLRKLANRHTKYLPHIAILALFLGLMTAALTLVTVRYWYVDVVHFLFALSFWWVASVLFFMMTFPGDEPDPRSPFERAEETQGASLLPFGIISAITFPLIGRFAYRVGQLFKLAIVAYIVIHAPWYAYKLSFGI